MEQYEIRITKEGRALRAHCCFQASDLAAIRRGRAMAAGREGFEVWRAATCVYAGPGQVLADGDI